MRGTLWASIEPQECAGCDLEVNWGTLQRSWGDMVSWGRPVGELGAPHGQGWGGTLWVRRPAKLWASRGGAQARAPAGHCGRVQSREGKGRRWPRPGRRAGRQDSPRAAAAGGRAPSSSGGSSSNSVGLGVILACPDLGVLGVSTGTRVRGRPSLGQGPAAASTPVPGRGTGVRAAPPSLPALRAEEAAAGSSVGIKGRQRVYTNYRPPPPPPVSKHRLDSWRL